MTALSPSSFACLSWSRTWAMVPESSGQMSVQVVKTKSATTTLPARCAEEKGRPVWSGRLKSGAGYRTGSEEAGRQATLGARRTAGTRRHRDTPAPTPSPSPVVEGGEQRAWRRETSQQDLAVHHHRDEQQGQVQHRAEEQAP